MTGQEQAPASGHPDPGVATGRVLWLGLSLVLLLAGSLAAAAGIFALSGTAHGPGKTVAGLSESGWDAALQGVPLERQAAPPPGATAPPARVRRAMAAIADRPDPEAPLTAAEQARFDTPAAADAGAHDPAGAAR